ncbi:MAG: hypothetical protein ABIJ21_02485 [Nanoarchaeota archaeon]
MKNFGNLTDKKEMHELFAPQRSNLPPAYKTSYWERIHSMVDEAFLPECDIDEAAIIIIQLAADLIDGFKKGNIALHDFHYAQEVFTNVNCTYSKEMDLYLIFDEHLYGLVEGLDFGSDIDEIEGFFKEFMDYLQKKHPTVHARIKKYCEGLQKKRKEKHAEKK